MVLRERPLMRRGIAPQCHPAHDHHAGGSCAEAEPLGDAEPIPAGAARTDDRDGPVGIERADQLAVSGPVEHRRRAGPGSSRQAGKSRSAAPIVHTGPLIRRSSPEREGRGNMVGVDLIARAQVGDGASDPQHAIVAASRETHPPVPQGKLGAGPRR